MPPAQLHLRQLRAARAIDARKCASGSHFFFQAEDGIRDHCVTGVQTCALPISGTVPGQAAWPGTVPGATASPAGTIDAFQTMTPFWLPTINTALLLTSGVTLTIAQDRKSVV